MKDVQVKKMTKGTNTFSSEGYEGVSSAMKQMMGIGVMVCPPYTFVVGKFLGELFIIDTRVIPNHLGGTENRVVILFSNIVHFLQCILCRLESSDVKTNSHHDIFQTSVPPNNTSQAEDNTTIHVDTHQDLAIDTYEEANVEDETYFSFSEQEKDKPPIRLELSGIEILRKTQSPICRFSEEETDKHRNVCDCKIKHQNRFTCAASL